MWRGVENDACGVCGGSNTFTDDCDGPEGTVLRENGSQYGDCISVDWSCDGWRIAPYVQMS